MNSHDLVALVIAVLSFIVLIVITRTLYALVKSTLANIIPLMQEQIAAAQEMNKMLKRLNEAVEYDHLQREDWAAYKNLKKLADAVDFCGDQLEKLSQRKTE